jgi:hypothetical protein
MTDDVKPKRKYIRRAKTVQFTEEEIEPETKILSDIEDLCIKEETDEPVRTVWQSLMRAHKGSVDLYVYCEKPDALMMKYLKELEKFCFTRNVGTQFILYLDPKPENFDSGLGLCFVKEQPLKDFRELCLGPKGTPCIHLSKSSLAPSIVYDEIFKLKRQVSLHKAYKLEAY